MHAGTLSPGIPSAMNQRGMKTVKSSINNASRARRSLSNVGVQRMGEPLRHIVGSRCVHLGHMDTTAAVVPAFRMS